MVVSNMEDIIKKKITLYYFFFIYKLMIKVVELVFTRQN
jgi:hypothetical protein